jgi:hypothetical protein
MTLATVSEASRPRRVPMRRCGRISVGLDALVLVFSLLICVAFAGALFAGFFHGALAALF